MRSASYLRVTVRVRLRTPESIAKQLTTPPSSRGLGRGPFKAKTGVRIPVGAYAAPDGAAPRSSYWASPSNGTPHIGSAHIPVGHMQRLTALRLGVPTGLRPVTELHTLVRHISPWGIMQRLTALRLGVFWLRRVTRLKSRTP